MEESSTGTGIARAQTMSMSVLESRPDGTTRLPLVTLKNVVHPSTGCSSVFMENA